MRKRENEERENEEGKRGKSHHNTIRITIYHIREEKIKRKSEIHI